MTNQMTISAALAAHTKAVAAERAATDRLADGDICDMTGEVIRDNARTRAYAAAGEAVKDAETAIYDARCAAVWPLSAADSIQEFAEEVEADPEGYGLIWDGDLGPRRDAPCRTVADALKICRKAFNLDSAVHVCRWGSAEHGTVYVTIGKAADSTHSSEGHTKWDRTRFAS
jgi:hypothetical protein